MPRLTLLLLMCFGVAACLKAVEGATTTIYNYGGSSSCTSADTIMVRKTGCWTVDGGSMWYGLTSDNTMFEELACLGIPCVGANVKPTCTLPLLSPIDQCFINAAGDGTKIKVESPTGLNIGATTLIWKGYPDSDPSCSGTPIATNYFTKSCHFRSGAWHDWKCVDGTPQTTICSDSSCTSCSTEFTPSTSCTSGGMFSCGSGSSDGESDTCYPAATKTSVDLTSNGFMPCPQSCSQWCWATCIAEVENFFKHQTTECALDECAIVQELYTRSGVPRQCCSGTLMEACAYCNSPAGNAAIMSQMLLYRGIKNIVTGVVSEATLKAELSNNRPVILGWTLFTSGHVGVLYGYDSLGRFLLADPWGGQFFQQTYQELMMHNTQQWSMTFLGLALDNRCLAGSSDGSDGYGVDGSDSNSDSSSFVCFPSNARIELIDGQHKAMSELKIGDIVATAQGFNPVIAFLHRDTDIRGDFLVIRYSNGTSIQPFGISLSHLLPIIKPDGTSEFVRADSLTPGKEQLILHSGKPADIISMHLHHSRGAFAPLTAEGTIVVDGVRASCYAEIDNHQQAHNWMAPLRWISQVMPPGVQEEEEPLHWWARTLLALR